MVKRVTKEIKSTVETELRKGTSKSRIAHLLGVPYEEGVQIITQIKESIRPEVGNRIRFTFREQEMIGIIWKLLANSAVVVIDWNSSNQCMKDICEARTVVNFKDIVEFLGPFYFDELSNLGPLKYNINEMTVEEIDD